MPDRLIFWQKMDLSYIYEKRKNDTILILVFVKKM